MQINIEYIMKTVHIITFLISLLLIISCSITKPLLTDNTTVNVRDSIIIHQVDSIVYHPKERIVDIVPVYDTLKMSTSIADAKAYVDTTTHTLKGSLKNKQGTTTKIKYVDRVQYRDSIQIKEVPYPVEVTKEVIKYKHYWYDKLCYPFAIIGLIYIILIIIKLYGKFRL